LECSWEGFDPNGSNQICLEWNISQIYWSYGVWNGINLA